ncbi:uncharacterized protein TNIN_404721 [Trichonephila inaurata madagascariensis]|uniref:lysozyme n=1 Tax=Trichonephila inaurata madagascariensis TaxID=2747483 RepID=A0A8X7C9D1_9ARAC|nr:uncharacterized protein TNIN_404721 [Trichonephila inaurata madagascariensis]
MTLLLLIPLAIFTTCVSAQWPARVRVPEVDQNCMECICQASTSCDETAKCHYDGANNYFCGPYVISWAYWFDGGKHGNRGQPGDFETCLKNRKERTPSKTEVRRRFTCTRKYGGRRLRRQWHHRLCRLCAHP